MAQAVAKRATGAELAVVEGREETFALLKRALQNEVDLAEAYDTVEVQRAMASGIVEAQTEDEAFADASLEPWSKFLDEPVRVLDIHFNPSTAEKGPNVYAACRIVHEATGEVLVVHVGGYRPTAQLLWLWAHGRLPFRCKLIEVAKAKQGQNAPLGIERLDD